MRFDAVVLRGISDDPYFKIEFAYENDECLIKRGTAEVLRKPPKPEIIYEPRILEKIDSYNKEKLDLEIMNVVLEYIMRNGVYRNWRGSIIKCPA